MTLQSRPFPHKIHKISVQYDKEHVWGIKIVYQDGLSQEVFHYINKRLMERVVRDFTRS